MKNCFSSHGVHLSWLFVGFLSPARTKMMGKMMKKDTFMILPRRRDPGREDGVSREQRLAPGSGCYRRLPSKYPITSFSRTMRSCAASWQGPTRAFAGFAGVAKENQIGARGKIKWSRGCPGQERGHGIPMTSLKHTKCQRVPNNSRKAVPG